MKALTRCFVAAIAIMAVGALLDTLLLKMTLRGVTPAESAQS